MRVNRRLFDYDQLIIVGPVFPHEIVGHKHTSVRKVVDRAASMVTVPKRCFALVVRGNGLVGAPRGGVGGSERTVAAASRHVQGTALPHDFLKQWDRFKDLP